MGSQSQVKLPKKPIQLRLKMNHLVLALLVASAFIGESLGNCGYPVSMLRHQYGNIRKCGSCTTDFMECNLNDGASNCLMGIVNSQLRPSEKEELKTALGAGGDEDFAAKIMQKAVQCQ